MTGFILAFIILVCLFILTVYAFYNLYKMQKSEIAELEAEVKTRKSNMDALVKYAQELGQIVADYKKTNNAIEVAENEEEILNIINSIVSGNNDRVRNDTKDGTDSSAETGA